MLCYLCGVVKRLFLFQFIFIFAFLKFRDQSTSAYDMKDKIYEFTTLVNFKHPMLEQILVNPLQAFQLFFGIMTVSAFFGLLGSRFFSFLTGLCLIKLNFLYYNPMRINPTTKKPELNLTDLSNLNLNQLQQLPLEFILITVLAFALFTQSFKRCNRKDYNYESTPGVEEVRETRREVRPSSKKGKKQI
jgi:hypothetical protein